jgi:hypothetical protein
MGWNRPLALVVEQSVLGESPPERAEFLLAFALSERPVLPDDQLAVATLGVEIDRRLDHGGRPRLEVVLEVLDGVAPGETGDDRLGLRVAEFEERPEGVLVYLRHLPDDVGRKPGL